MNLADRWASTLGGVALLFSAMRRRSGSKWAALIAAELIRRGVTGHSYAYDLFGTAGTVGQGGKNVSVPYQVGEHARAAITIAKPRSVIYRFWRDFQNLPRVMEHLVSVEPRSGTRSHWVAEGPAGKRVAWDAEIHNDIPEELIAWRSLPDSEVQTAGSVHFKDAPGGRGTEVIVHMKYNPPAGLIGATVAKLAGRNPEGDLENGLFRLKQYLETGEIATAGPQPHGDGVAAGKPVIAEVLT